MPKKIKKVITPFPAPITPSKLILEPTVSNILWAYNLELKSMQRLLGIENLTKDHYVNDILLVSQIDSKYRHQKRQWHQSKGVIDIQWKQAISIDNKYEQAIPSFQEITRLIHLDINLFKTVKKNVSIGNTKLKSKFTDIEAINICKKMCSSYSRNLCKQYEKSFTKSTEILFQIHYIANKALEIFGGYVISFWYNLRPLKFKNQTALEVRTYKNVVPDFPILTIKSKDFNYKVSFFTKQRSNRTVTSEIKVVDSERKHVAYLNKEGYILGKLQRFSPYLTVFYEATKSGKYEISSGVETGICDICEKPLSVERSLRIGIGPVCERKYGYSTF